MKLSLVGPADQVLDSLTIDPWHGQGSTAEMAAFAAGLDDVGAVGHRVAHGGSRFRGPAMIGYEVRAAIAGLTGLTPLHQPRALAGIDATAELLPHVPAVACFDTALHAGLPEPTRCPRGGEGVPACAAMGSMGTPRGGRPSFSIDWPYGSAS